MPWTTPVDQITGHVVTATDWNATGQDDLTFLFGDAAWTNVSVFTGTWAAGSITPRFILLGRTVSLQGHLSTGTINTAAFTLPAGYRPTQNLCFPAVSPAGASGAFASFTIATTGVLTPQVGSTTNFTINCSFSVV